MLKFLESRHFSNKLGIRKYLSSTPSLRSTESFKTCKSFESKGYINSSILAVCNLLTNSFKLTKKHLALVLWLITKYWTTQRSVFVKVKVTSVTKRELLKMCHLRQRLSVFYFAEKFCSVLNMFKFAFLTIAWFIKSVAPWWVLVHVTGCIFEYIFWTTSH